MRNLTNIELNAINGGGGAMTPSNTLENSMIFWGIAGALLSSPASLFILGCELYSGIAVGSAILKAGSFLAISATTGTGLGYLIWKSTQTQ